METTRLKQQPNLLELFTRRFDIPHDNLKFIPTDMLRQAIINGNTNHIHHNIIAIISRRYNLLWQHKYAKLFDQLYQVNNNDKIKIKVACNYPHPLETIILNLDSYPSSYVLDMLDIIIPKNKLSNQYIRDNITSYAKILKRGHIETISLDVMKFMDGRDIVDYLTKLTDKEIFTDIGVWIPYANRNELVINIANCIVNQQFMFPLMRSDKYSINKITVVGLNSIHNEDIFMICYGDPSRYIIYELYDLIESFKRNGNIIEFTRPESKDKKFTLHDIEGLKNLLKCFSLTADIKDLLSIIAKGFADLERDIDYDKEARQQLGRFDDIEQNLIKEYLYQIFYIGMYMRHWVGPGYPYPLREEDTHNDNNIEVKISVHVGEALELLNKMSKQGIKFCFNLRVCQYNSNGTIDYEYEHFGDEWNLVIKGVNCIRIASSKFVGTGYHYLRSLFMETIVGVDVKHIDKIY